MKKLTVCILTALLLCCLVLNVQASDEKSRLIDEADILTESQKNEIKDTLDKISDEFQYDVVIKTAKTANGASEAAYARNAFKSGGYGMGEKQSGVILVIFELDRRAYIEFFGEQRLPEGTTLLEELVAPLKSNDYAAACLQFTSTVDSELSFPWLRNIAIAVIIGLLVALLVTSSMKSKLKSVRYQSNAREYIKGGSFKLHRERDLYLYSTITRIPRPKSNSGGSRGGGGGSRGGGISF